VIPLPGHVYRRWRLLNQLIDLALALGIPPSRHAEDAAAAIAGEWQL